MRFIVIHCFWFTDGDINSETSHGNLLSNGMVNISSNDLFLEWFFVLTFILFFIVVSAESFIAKYDLQMLLDSVFNGIGCLSIASSKICSQEKYWDFFIYLFFILFYFFHIKL